MPRGRVFAVLSRPEAAFWIVAAGTLVRLLYILALRHKAFHSDAASYVRMAGEIAAGRQFVPFWPPGLPLYLAAVQHVVGGSVGATRAAMLAFYFLISAALSYAAVLATGKVWAGNVALLILAISPGMVCYSVEPITELPAAALVAALAACLARILKSNGGESLLVTCMVCGFALGALTLTRPSSLLLTVVAPPFVMWSTRRPWTGALVALVPAVMVMGWVLYLYHGTGRAIFINTSNSKNFYLGNNPQTPLYRTWWLGSHHELDASLLSGREGAADPQVLDREYTHAAREYIKARPGQFLLRTFNRVCVFFVFDTYASSYAEQTYGMPRMAARAMLALDALLYFAMFFGSVCSLSLRNATREQGALPWILAAALGLYAAPYFLAFSHPRYHVPVEPLLILGLVLSLAAVRKAGLAKAPLRLGRAFAAILVFVLIQVEFVVILRHFV